MKDIPKNQCPQGKSHKPNLPIFVHRDLDDYGLDVYEFRLYARIARRAGKDGESFESIAHMATGCQMCEGTVKRALKRLIEMNAIIKRSRPGRSTVYRPNSLDLWLPRSDMTQVTRDPGVGLRDPEVDFRDPGVDLRDPLPRSDMTHEVTPPSSSPEVFPNRVSLNNNSSRGSSIDENSAYHRNLTTADESEQAYGDKAGDIGEPHNSASLNLQQAKKLGIDICSPALLEVAKQYPDRIDSAIAYTTKKVEDGKIRDSVTGYLIKAIQHNFKLNPPVAAANINEGWGEWFEEARRRGIVMHGAGRAPDGVNQVVLVNGETLRFCDLKDTPWSLLKKRIQQTSQSA